MVFAFKKQPHRLQRSWVRSGHLKQMLYLRSRSAKSTLLLVTISAAARVRLFAVDMEMGIPATLRALGNLSLIETLI